MKKTFTLISLLVLISMLFTACAPTVQPTTAGQQQEKPAEAELPADQPADKPQMPVGTNAWAYDPNKPVNDGKPITIKFWTWNGFDYLYEQWAKDYQEIHPNVTIEFTMIPWAEYWKKLPLAISSGQGPDVYAMHNQFTSVIIDGNMAQSYPDEWLPKLREDFDMIDAHLINGKLYYFDSGIMTSMIFYNKKMWADAGLTEADYPKTWDELTEVAKKLTKKDDAGKIVQEGFGINGYAGYAVDMLSYQLGAYIYDKEGRKVDVSDERKQALQRVIDWFDKDQVSSRDFPNNNDAFAQQKTAMMYMWGWYNGFLKANNPEVEFGLFKLPTWTGEMKTAYDRNNGESTFNVNPKASPEAQLVAFDFVHYCFDNENYTIDIAINGSMAPVMKRIQGDSRLNENMATVVTMEVLDRTLWPGAFSTGWDPIKTKTVVDGVKTGMPADQILKMYEDENNKDLTKYESVYWDKERSYKYASDMQP